MQFHIADTFTASLARLTGEEQKAVKTAAFDLQMNPAHPSLQFHRIERSKDTRFWSVRASSDLRLIVHKTEDSLLLCYVDHHDQAYDWASRRKLETHPTTGAAQLVEIREMVREIEMPIYVPGTSKPRLFEQYSEETLLYYGVPPEWIADVRAAGEDTLLELIDHLPAEAAEALWDIALGHKPALPEKSAPGASPFAHIDAQRRFRVMHSEAELEQALEAPWEKWAVFLHPTQRQLVERSYNGPARVSGTAGTGKTVVALHRAVHLARKHDHTRVLLATFSKTLANALIGKRNILVRSEPHLADRIEVYDLNTLAKRLYRLNFGGQKPKMAPPSEVKQLLAEAAAAIEGHKFTLPFLWTEWEEVVDARQVDTWEDYRDVPRLGRKIRLPDAQRQLLWQIFERVQTQIKVHGWMTQSEIYAQLTLKFERDSQTPYQFVVVDEAQDVSIPQLRFLAALAGQLPDGLFFAGDLGQRIFQQPFSWKSLGVDVRGRSFTLRINYRTSHQIREQADRLLGPDISDVDGNMETRRNAVSVFHGPPPEIQCFENPQAETAAVATWLQQRIAEKLPPEEIGVFVRSDQELASAKSAVEAAGLPYKILSEDVAAAIGFVSISTMHLAKGLEFKAVVVMACNHDVIPSEERLAQAGDESDLKEIYDTERHLLYVACTRARDYLLVTASGAPSEFLADMQF